MLSFRSGFITSYDTFENSLSHEKLFAQCGESTNTPAPDSWSQIIYATNFKPSNSLLVLTPAKLLEGNTSQARGLDLTVTLEG